MRCSYKTERVKKMAVKKSRQTDIQHRHRKRRQQRIREQKIRRCIFFAFLAAIVIFVVVFFTPIFDIRSVSVIGNERVPTEQILEKTGDLTGRNLFGMRKKPITQGLMDFAYIDKVSVKKKPFPPTLILDIKECKPTVQIEYAESFITIDRTGKILEKSPEKLEGIPVCSGLKIISANEGEEVGFKDDEVKKIVLGCISAMEKNDVLGGIVTMSFADMTNITFNYQSRLDVICGTHIDFQRKLALFNEAINSNNLTENSRGTINLSTTGKAIYRP